MSERILVSFTPEQLKILKSLKGKMGNTNAEVIRVIVMSWLSENDYFKNNIKGGKFNE